MDINNPFETFERSAFRLEALPQYIAPEESESFGNFIKTGSVNELDSGWADTVTKAKSAGKKMERLRLLSRELTDYERFEVQTYSGPRSGEEIKTALRQEYQDQYLYDFWMFDAKWIAQIHYEPDGTFVKFDIRQATSEELDMYRYWRSVYENARPLRQVPFVANTPDDTHCLQAAYMSIAEYFNPQFQIDMDKWSELTGYEEGLGTWANAGLVWFKEHGYEVVHYELFDFDEFMKQPKEYMIQVHGEEAGTWGYEHTNVAAEIPRMKKLVEVGVTHQIQPTIQHIKDFIDSGCLVRVLVNAGRFSGEAYAGHAVVVTGYSDTHIQFHDPGLPPIPNRQATIEAFEAAWDDQERELDAIRRLST